MLDRYFEQSLTQHWKIPRFPIYKEGQHKMKEENPPIQEMMQYDWTEKKCAPVNGIMCAMWYLFNKSFTLASAHGHHVT